MTDHTPEIEPDDETEIPPEPPGPRLDQSERNRFLGAVLRSYDDYLEHVNDPVLAYQMFVEGKIMFILTKDQLSVAIAPTAQEIRTARLAEIDERLAERRAPENLSVGFYL